MVNESTRKVEHTLVPVSQPVPRRATKTLRPGLIHPSTNVRKGDCIMGTESRSTIVTLVEHVTRYLILVPVLTGRPTASGVRDGIVAAMSGLQTLSPANSEDPVLGGPKPARAGRRYDSSVQPVVTFQRLACSAH